MSNKNDMFEEDGTIFLATDYDCVTFRNGSTIYFNRKECDCGAVATYGKEAPSRCHANWCATKEVV